jgi:hypothetical protein
MNRKYILVFLVWLTSVVCNGAVIVSVKAALAATEDNKIQPLITTAELIVGENRFAFGLVQANRLIENADVLVRLYLITDQTAKLVAEINAPYQSVRSIATKNAVHRHADGTRHVHTSDSAVRGLYVTRLNFTQPGTWGVELFVQENGVTFEPIRLSVTVFETPRTPAIGMSAPRSQNLIAEDVKNLREIDTSTPPDPRLHQVRIADAIAQGKPQLIVFATPQFCTSRMCGPVVDIVRTLLPIYGKRVAFTHQEIWQDFASKKTFYTVDEWRLQSEPWIFIVDGQGIIRAKFEGLVTERELEVALQQILRTGRAFRNPVDPN